MINTMINRKSVRKYTDQPIEQDKIELLLKAGMSGPTAVNARPWSFIVVKEQETLHKMADANGHAAQCLKGAKLGILICGDLNRAFSRAPEYWIVDCSIAAQNMILAAENLGLGSVWLGTWPQQDKIEHQRELFDLPEHIVPHSLLSFGYPDDEKANEKEKMIWEEDRVHYGKW